MGTIPHNGNGHRRRQVRARVLAEEDHCVLCGQVVDKTLSTLRGKHGEKCHNPQCKGCVPHPMRAEVDEDIPRARGGSPYERSNTTLMHRRCNRWKGTMTLAEARTKWNAEQPAATTRRTTTLVQW
jgi:5-methylcytosine-specific restriction endonuclease McrA